MITGLHAIVFTADADADRAFFRDVLEFPAVDAGGGWLIFTMPPAELACHPVQTDGPAETDGPVGPVETDGPGRTVEVAAHKDGGHELYLMCDDVHATVATLAGRGVRFADPVTDQGWGLLTSFTTPGGTKLGLYEPRHPTALAVT
jgi:catechol 2,3-dioxygenase-like lactoylglutathione lyase family enzyme